MAASSAILSVTPAGFESYTKMADSIAAQIVDTKHRARLVGCTPKAGAPSDDGCATQVISRYGLALYRRPLTQDELKSRVKLAATIAASSGDFYTGLRYALGSMLAAQNFLFRVETAVPDGKTEWTLDGYGRAARLSFLFWDTTPDAALLDAARTGALNDPAGIAHQVDRLMGSPRLLTGMRAFYSDFLELDSFNGITKDATIYPKYSDLVADAAKEETLRTMIDLTLNQKGDLRDLLTTRQTYINRILASIYDVPYNFDGEWVPYEFAPDSGRSGVLTQVTFLAMFSHPGRSSPTKRGVALNDAIFMCQPTPAHAHARCQLRYRQRYAQYCPTLRTVRQRLRWPMPPVPSAPPVIPTTTRSVCRLRTSTVSAAIAPARMAWPSTSPRPCKASLSWERWAWARPCTTIRVSQPASRARCMPMAWAPTLWTCPSSSRATPSTPLPRVDTASRCCSRH